MPETEIRAEAPMAMCGVQFIRIADTLDVQEQQTQHTKQNLD